MFVEEIESTAMSILHGAANVDSQIRQLALKRFCHQYTQPLVDYLIHAKRIIEDQANCLPKEIFGDIHLISISIARLQFGRRLSSDQPAKLAGKAKALSGAGWLDNKSISLLRSCYGQVERILSLAATRWMRIDAGLPKMQSLRC